MTMANVPPQRAKESAQAYEAFVEYCLMGADRSQEHVSRKLGKNKVQMHRWSTTHDWVARSREYDQAVANENALAVQQKIRRKYLTDLETHRKKSMDAAVGLYTVAGQLLNRLSEQVNQPARQLFDERGRAVDIPAMEVPAGMLGTIKNTFATALDLEAHALGLDALMPRLVPADGEE
jgi:hypothetical protein